MSNKSGLGDVFIAFHNANCTDLNKFKSVLESMWNDKALNMSQDWYENKLPKVIKNEESLIKNIEATVAGTNGWAKNKQDFIDTKYVDMITATSVTNTANTAKPTRKTKKNTENTPTVNVTVSQDNSNKINLRTVLTYYGNEKMFDSKEILPQIKKMENDGVIKQGDYDFIANGPGKTPQMFASTINKCLQGTSWQGIPLQTFNEFSNYIPAKYKPTYIMNHSETKTTNNVRTIIAALYKKGECNDALKVAGVLSDLKSAGFKNMDYNLIPGLVNMTESELQKLGESAVKGTGLFKDQKIVKDKVLLDIL